MTELEVLEQLEAEKHILARRGDVEEMKRSALEFCKHAVVRLADRGWRLLRSPSPAAEHVYGLRYQHIVNRETLEVRDIIVRSREPDRYPAWQDAGTAARELVVEPVPVVDDGTPAPPDAPPPTPGDGDQPDSLMTLLALILDALQGITPAINELQQEIEQLASVIADQREKLSRDGLPLRVKL